MFSGLLHQIVALRMKSKGAKRIVAVACARAYSISRAHKGA